MKKNIMYFGIIIILLTGIVGFSIWQNDYDWRLTPRFSFDEASQNAEIEYGYSAFGRAFTLSVTKDGMLYEERVPERINFTVQNATLLPRLLSAMEDNHFEYMKTRYECGINFETYQVITLFFEGSSYSTSGICGIPDEVDNIAREFWLVLVEHHDGNLSRWNRYGVGE